MASIYRHFSVEDLRKGVVKISGVPPKGPLHQPGKRVWASKFFRNWWTRQGSNLRPVD